MNQLRDEHLLASVAASAFPQGPYPGLRPFYDNESTFFFGRTRHSEEIVNRLSNKSRFVAIIGGSGSGKSSLVRAGVIPRLRTHGIRDVGDLWIPLVMTPGTNPSSLNQSPITRLARRFSAILKPLPSMKETENRIEEIAAVFRQEAGFERILNCFVSELAVPPGASPYNARILFIIDQFEEIFHVTNVGIPDVRVFVDRIVDHFFNPHPSCFIILTMRSEYLNNCPSYLELPDTINSSLYLVPRLDRDEIREAIVDPPRIFNRYVRRKNPEMTTIPIAPQFSAEVLDRILADTENLTDDPDHLPLLQHLLARLWQVACDRGDIGKGAIDSITWEDLEAAVSAVAGVAIPQGINVLCSCLENWANAAYSSFEASERGHIDQILRQLAFKDPNTGTYTQQRLVLNASTPLLSGNKSTSGFRHKLELKFIEKVSYLSWDNESPTAPSLKVSHESFIRGWSHFLNLINEEANRFEEFLNVLKKCLSWSTSRESDKLLLGSADLVLIEKANLQSALTNEKDGEDWFKVLKYYRDGKELAKAKPYVEKFYNDSREKERQRTDEINRLEKLERQRIARNRTIFAGAVALVCLCLTLGFTFPEWLLFTNELVPATSDVLLKKAAAVRALRHAHRYANPEALKAVASASHEIISANGSQDSILANLDRRLYFQFPVTRDLLLGGRIRVLKDVLAGSWNDEPDINYMAHQILSSRIWKTKKPPGSPHEIPTRVDKTQDRMKCQDLASPESMGQDFIPEARFVQRSNASGRVRSLLVTDKLRTRPGQMVLLGNDFYSPGGNCIAQTILFAVPNKLNPMIMFDSSMQYLFVVMNSKDKQSDVLAIYSLDWDWKQTDPGRAWKERFVITDPSIVGSFSEGTKRDAVSVSARRSWDYEDGVVIENGVTYWKIVLQEAVRQVSKKEHWKSLNPSKGETVCQSLRGGVSSGSGVDSLLYENESHCILINQVPSADEGTSTSGVGANREDSSKLVQATIYSRVSMKTSKDSVPERPIPLSIVEFGRPLTSSADWFVGKPNTPFDGWIAHMVSSIDNDTGEYLIAPWSTDSLRKIACDLIRSYPASPGQMEVNSQKLDACEM